MAFRMKAIGFFYGPDSKTSKNCYYHHYCHEHS